MPTRLILIFNKQLITWTRTLTPPSASRILLLLSAIFLLCSLNIFSKNISSTISIKYLFLNPLQIRVQAVIDPTSLTFARLICFISANVIQFTQTYIETDKFISRFSKILFSFIASIITLVFSKSYIFLLLGWDGLGLSSFLLVAYYQNRNSLAARIITAIINRIGDALILISIALLLTRGHWVIRSTIPPPFKKIFISLIIIATITKSAQIPFSTWLPAAIAAPTPVSALVHSSTLVTAGVYLLIRFYPTIQSAPLLQPTLLLFSSITIIIAGITAMFECDIKKIIALSTLSQLGLMIATIALGQPTLATFHLFTHALFKALLFLSAGTIIYHSRHAQDLRRLGNTARQLPVTSTCICVANTALCGTPFLAGFFSKDLILEIALSSTTNLLIVILFFFATALTSAYSVRFIALLLWPPISSSPLHTIADENVNLLMPQLRLTLATIFSGLLAMWALFPTIPHPIIPLSIKLLPITSALFGVFIAWYTLNYRKQTKIPTKPVTPLQSIWFLIPLTSQNVLTPLVHAPNIINLIDHRWLSMLLRSGPFIILKNIAKNTQHLQASTVNAFLLRAIILSLTLLFMY